MVRPPAIIAENKLKQNFNVDAPDTIWVTDITYIKTHEGWMYLAVVIDFRIEVLPSPLRLLTVVQQDFHCQA